MIEKAGSVINNFIIHSAKKIEKWKQNLKY
jgi:hypothetical protein